MKPNPWQAPPRPFSDRRAELNLRLMLNASGVAIFWGMMPKPLPK